MAARLAHNGSMIGHDPAPRREPVGGERWLVLGAFLLAVGGLLAVVLEDYEPVRLAPVFMLLAHFPLIALHEAGHAAMAAALGWKVEALVVGFGRDALRFELWGVPVTVRMYPLGGWVLPTPTHLRGARWRSALIYLAGPLAELLLVGALALGFGLETLITRSEALPVIAAQAVCVGALFDVVWNLLPRRIETEHGESATDGLGAIRSVLRERTSFTGAVREHHREALLGRVALGDVEGAASACEAAYAALGDDPQMRSAMRGALDRLAEDRDVGAALRSARVPSALRERYSASE